ncbi:hypothetical protein ACZ90_58770 [Streptomyces albus subsp. albus]|nr:hypothetical protein ACZ90_58770 [Streptomyces albus subsp. albus]
MLDQGDERALGLAAVACVGDDDRRVRPDLEGLADLFGGVGLVSVEAVEGDDEGEPAVLVLSCTWLRSSIPAEAEVITASVRSGLISDTAPTNVVLPTPKPPATTIFAEVVERAGAASELAKSTEHPFQQCHVRRSARV